MHYQLHSRFLSLKSLIQFNSSGRSNFQNQEHHFQFDMERVLAKLSHTHSRKLEINQMELNNKIISIISETKWPQLQLLIISCNFTPAHCRILKKDLWTTQKLYLSGKTLDFSSFIKQSIVSSAHLKQIHIDSLSKFDLQKFVENKWPHLQSITIINCPFQIETSISFKAANWKQLSKLELIDCRLRGRGLRELVKAKLKQIAALNLSLNNIGNEGIDILIKGQFTGLQNLDISSNQIHEAGIKHLLKANFKLLARVFSSRNQSESFQIYTMLCLSNFHEKFVYQNKQFMEKIKLTRAQSRKYYNKILSNKFLKAKLFLS